MAYDLVVVGGGSGGLAAAKRASALGARVALVESGQLGGTCVHRGCIPKKILAYAAAFREEFRLSQGYGYEEIRAGHSWSRLRQAKDDELKRLLGYYEKSTAEAGVEVVPGRARLLGQGKVQVEGGPLLEAETICLAVGARPHKLELPGYQLAAVSDDVFDLERLPEQAVVQGSGYIGVEMASILQGLGCRTTLLYRSQLPLPNFDGDLRSGLAAELTRRGVDIRPGTPVKGLERRGDRLLVLGTDLDCDLFLCATGRRANTDDLGLEAAGVECDERGVIQVDSDWRTSAPNVYALGDCASEVQLTPYAIRQGRTLADRLWGSSAAPFPTLVPTAVFALPPVASVGLTEEQARREGDVDVYRAHFRSMRHQLGGSQEKTLVKLVVRRSDERVLGAHMLGAEAPEVIQALAIALTAGATKGQVDATLALHPTVSEEIVLLREPVQ